MATEAAKALAKQLSEERAARYRAADEERTYMTQHKVCPACAVPVQVKWCGFMWQCCSYICPKCGKRQDTYPYEGIV